MIEPEFISSLEAITGLETPQIILEWVYGSPDTPITEGVSWVWDSLYLRRSLYRYPESITDGDEVLTESESSSPSINCADITNLESLRSYYYSLFFSYTEHSSSEVGLNAQVGRIGSKFYSIGNDKVTEIIAGTDGSTVGTTSFSSPGSAFLTSGVEAGFILVIEDGTVDDGEYAISSVDSETSITLETAVTLTSSTVDFYIKDNHHKFWISGKDYSNESVLWKYDSESSLVEFKIDLSSILNAGELPLSVSYAGTVYGESADSISIVTNFRFLRIPYSNANPEIDDIINSWDLDTLVDGYNVAGSFLDPGIYNISSNTVYILDNHHQEIKLLSESDGSIVSTIDVSDLPEVSNYTLRGLCANYTDGEIYIGNRNYVYVVPYTASSPVSVTEVLRVIHARNLIISDFCGYTEAFGGAFTGGEYDEFDYDEEDYSSFDLNTVSYLVTVNDESDQLYSFRNLPSFYLWQQPSVPDTNTIGLYHLDESSGDPQDSSALGNHGTNGGMIANQSARFSTGFLADSISEYIDFTSIASDFDGSEGTVSLWFQATDPTDLISGDCNLFTARVDSGNYVRIGVVSDQLYFEYTAGSTTGVITGGHPDASDSLRLARFHNYAIRWSATEDTFKAYIDGEQFGSTVGSLGTWVGTPATVTIGANSTAGYEAALGLYDEVNISKISHNFTSVVTSYTSANKMHAHSGRDYEGTYENGDPLGFFYRDEFFTQKFMGGDYLIRNDYDRQKLHPPNNVMDNSEIIFRGPSTLPELGHLGRLSRFVGLLFDRISDDRELLLDMLNLRTADVDFFQTVANSLGIKGLDTENWNVDKQRRFLKIMNTIFKKAGRVDSYENYARFLGFFLVMDTLTARRRLDSVVYHDIDPYVQAIPLDTMGSMDTYHETYPLALLRFTPYVQSTKSTCTTSAAASRILTDSGANFKLTCNVGNLIKIPNTMDDAGDYIVEEIHSDTVLKVDRDWANGSGSSVVYYNCWKVSQYDPHTTELISRFLDISPDSMTLMHLDSSTVSE